MPQLQVRDQQQVVAELRYEWCHSLADVVKACESEPHQTGEVLYVGDLWAQQPQHVRTLRHLLPPHRYLVGLRDRPDGTERLDCPRGVPTWWL